jgi:hypothetical protein
MTNDATAEEASKAIDAVVADLIRTGHAENNAYAYARILGWLSQAQPAMIADECRRMLTIDRAPR